MSVSYLEHGRTQQKARTKTALIEATKGLLTRGITPTVEGAAEEASVSRATAYRYFPNRRALLVAAHPEIEAGTLLGDSAPAAPKARLDAVVDRIIEMTMETEPELRTMLRLSLEDPSVDPDNLPLRRGRRVTWVGDALSPLKGTLPRRELDRLVYAIAAAVGIDSLVWLTDVAGMSRTEAADLMRWSARALLRSALAESRG